MSAEEQTLIEKLFGLMPPTAVAAVEAAVTVADELRLTVYVVGGPVRDVLLGRTTVVDADLVVEGDALVVADALAARLGIRPVRHPRFGTATIKPGGFVLDIVTARAETYAAPGALPTVSESTIDDDLRRRDFSINAMAIALNGVGKGQLLDPLGGERDLRAGVVRALHAGSFEDDATRIFRATRYEARFGFRIERDTAAWIRRDVRYLDTISGARIHQELARTLAEKNPERALLRLDELGVLKAIHSALKFDSKRVQAFEVARTLDRKSARSAFWPLLAWNAKRTDIDALAKRLALRKLQAAAVSAVPPVRAVESMIGDEEMSDSAIVELLSPYPASTLLALASATESEAVRDSVVRYLRRLRRVKPALDGNDLLAMGAKEGPLIGDVLARIRVAKLDGEVSSRAEEEALAKRLLLELSR